MKVIVTGGAGFIGSHLVEGLLNNENMEVNKVTIIDNLSSGKKEHIIHLEDKYGKKIEFIHGDIRDLNLLRQTFRDAEFVFHHAAMVSVNESISNPLLFNDVNVNGTINVLIAARDNEVRKVIYASSSAVYGDNKDQRKKEDSVLNPISPYGISKLSGEYYCRVFSKTYGLKTISLRYFNVYGSRQNSFSEYSAVIPKFITNVLQDKSPVIYGDGKQTRDFVYVKDVVMANILAATKNVQGVFNIASGKETAIEEIENQITKLLNKPHLSPIHKPPRKGDIRHSLSDISLAKSKLGYYPKHDISHGLKETIEYYKSIFERIK